MRKTRFAGLTVVAPDETLAVDNSSFQSVNPDLVDHFLEVGAVTHRHDAHDPLADPLTQASGMVVNAGGTIGADVTVFLGYTLVDPDGGETRLSPALALTTDPPYEAPTSPINATATYASGALRSDTFYYAITLMDGGGGETPIGPVVSVDRQPGPEFASITLDGLRTDMLAYDAVGWRLYRATSGQQLGYLASGSADRFVDAGQGCVDCGQAPPNENRTNRTNKLTAIAPAGASGVPASGAASFRLYASQDGSFNTDCLVGEYPAASAGAPIEMTSLVLRPGRPPDVSTSVRGAARLNAETDLANYYWRAPVSGSANLPADLPGTARRALDTMEVFVAGSGAAAGGVGWARVGSATLRRVGVFGQPALELEEAVIRGSGGVRPVSVTRSGQGRGSGEVLIDWRPEILEGLSSGAAALTYDVGGPAGLQPVPASGGAQPTGLTERRFRVEGTYDDVEGRIRFRAVTSTAGAAGVILRGNGATGLVVRVNGGANQLEATTLGGTVLKTASIAGLLNVGGDYTVRGVVIGNRVLAELYDRPPSTQDARVAPIARFSVEIPRAQRPFIGAQVRGTVGGQVIAASLAWVISDLRFREAKRSLTIGDGTTSIDDPLAITLTDGLRVESDANGSALIRDPKVLGRVSTFGNGSVDDVRHLDIRGLSGTVTSLIDLGGGSARLEITASGGGGGGGFVQREWASASLNLASGASGITGLPLGIGYRIYRINADRPARARLYAGSGYQLADRARGLGVDPVNDHGVMLDFFLNSDLSWAMTPLVDGANLEDVPSNAIPVTLTNFGAAGVVTVAVMYARTE